MQRGEFTRAEAGDHQPIRIGGGRTAKDARGRIGCLVVPEFPAILTGECQQAILDRGDEQPPSTSVGAERPGAPIRVRQRTVPFATSSATSSARPLTA